MDTPTSDKKVKGFATGAFDPSVLGYTREDLAAMDDETRDEVMRAALNRAADILASVAGAFEADLTKGSREWLRQTSRSVAWMARKEDV